MNEKFLTTLILIVLLGTAISRVWIYYNKERRDKYFIKTTNFYRIILFLFSGINLFLFVGIYYFNLKLDNTEQDKIFGIVCAINTVFFLMGGIFYKEVLKLIYKLQYPKSENIPEDKINQPTNITTPEESFSTPKAHFRLLKYSFYFGAILSLILAIIFYFNVINVEKEEVRQVFIKMYLMASFICLLIGFFSDKISKLIKK